ncbi:hypothetical protein IVB45_25235 [Bradyrhizobium sp. 4]|uniref:hypothetical protein n=1 Tax=unclassified Bradyrhizobium TaxID=2631580 RepID=UPI001FFBB932|nr:MULTISPECIES: hypothetical protein [unclassified Bradyrhizobium]MCK1403205.1 hypothetical protein [Bradyrhizobium sp. 39]MCK1748801.1 hypothetical protein [Bradyrhizobium sp. 135]UPJ33242.1 hypothetical protein IVB45_25235 [Bradyrhizobium sp. 4]
MTVKLVIIVRLGGIAASDAVISAFPLITSQRDRRAFQERDVLVRCICAFALILVVDNDLIDLAGIETGEPRIERDFDALRVE